MRSYSVKSRETISLVRKEEQKVIFTETKQKVTWPHFQKKKKITKMMRTNNESIFLSLSLLFLILFKEKLTSCLSNANGVLEVEFVGYNTLGMTYFRSSLENTINLRTKPFHRSSFHTFDYIGYRRNKNSPFD